MGALACDVCPMRAGRLAACVVELPRSLPGPNHEATLVATVYCSGLRDLLPRLNSLNLNSLPAVALAFQEQLQDSIPMDAHDYPVDYVATCDGVVQTNSALDNSQPPNAAP